MELRRSVSDYLSVCMNALRIKPAETKITLLSGLYLFCTIGCFILSRIARTTFFLEIPDYRGQLPLAYIVVALTVSSVMAFYSHIERLLRRDQFNMATLCFLIVVTLIFRWQFHRPSHTLYWIFYVWVDVFGTLLVLQFWSLLNDIFNARQARRLYALIAGCGVTANIVVGFGIGHLVHRISTENILFVMCGFLTICFFCVRAIGRITNKQLQASWNNAHTKSSKTQGMSFRHVLKHHHLRFIAATVACCYIVSTILDYQFQTIIGDSIANKDARSAFLGQFMGITGIFSVIIQFFLTTRWVERFGIFTSLATLPVALLVGTGGLFFPEIIPALVAVTLAKGSENMLRYTIHESTLALLYVPVPERLRGKGKAVIDGIIKPVAIGFTGALIALFVGRFKPWHFGYITPHASTTQLSILVVLGVIAWLAVLRLLKTEYLKTLITTLRGRRFASSDTRIYIQDEASVQILKKTLHGSSEGEILHTLDLVRLITPALQKPILSTVEDLILHPSTSVRIQALAVLSDCNSINQQAIVPMLNDPSPDVRIAATLTYCASKPDDNDEYLAHLLEDPHPRVRAAAIAGQIRYADIEAVAHSAQRLKHMLKSPEVDERIAAAWVFGEVGIYNLDQILIALIHDEDPRVRTSAIYACRRLKNPKLIPALLEHLRDPRLKHAVVATLATFGEHAIKPMCIILNDITRHADEQVLAVWTLAKIDSPTAIEMLTPHINHKQPQVRHAIAHALEEHIWRGGRIALHEKIINTTIFDEASRYYTIFSQTRDLDHLTDTPSGFQLLQEALRRQMDQCKQAILALLALSLPPQTVRIIAINLRSQNELTRANAIELLENILPNEMRTFLIGVFDDGLTISASHQQSKKPEQCIENLLEDENFWIQACAIHAVADGNFLQLVPAVERLLNSPNFVCRETAITTLYRLKKEQLKKYKDILLGDIHPRIRAMAQAYLG